MLYLDADLPLGALVDQAGTALAAAMARAGAVWLQADPDHMNLQGEVVTSWRPIVGPGEALPAAPNRGNGRLGLDGLHLIGGKNCGFVLEAALADASCASFAVLYASPANDIRTLLSVNLREAKNYLFLFEQDGALGLKDQGNAGAASIPVANAAPVANPLGAGMKLAVGGIAGRRLYLRQNTGTVAEVQAPALDFGGPADLFIGCRSNRDGLVKTFGTGIIGAVFLWPDLNILDPDSTAGSLQLRALDQYRFWEA